MNRLLTVSFAALLFSTNQAHALYFAWHEDNNDGHVDPRPDDDDDDTDETSSSDTTTEDGATMEGQISFPASWADWFNTLVSGQ